VYKKTDRVSEDIVELQELRQNLQKLRKPAMREPFVHLCSEDGRDVAEHAVMVDVILLSPVSTLRSIGSNFNPVFTWIASAIG
jgi:hypothetical protein